MPAIEHYPGAIDGGDGRWIDYTPVLTQDAANATPIANTITYARYMIIGRTCFVEAKLTATAAGTAANVIVVTLPIVPVYTATMFGVGGFYYRSVAGSVDYRGQANVSNATNKNMSFRPGSVTAQADLGVNPAITVGNGDLIFYSCFYEIQ